MSNDIYRISRILDLAVTGDQLRLVKAVFGVDLGLNSRLEHDFSKSYPRSVCSAFQREEVHVPTLLDRNAAPAGVVQQEVPTDLDLLSGGSYMLASLPPETPLDSIDPEYTK